MKRAVLALVALVILAGGALAAFALYRHQQSKNVRGSSTEEFVTKQATVKRTPRELTIVPWPMFGYRATGIRFADGIDVRPPFRRLYLVNAYGDVLAINAETGKRAWRFRGRRCAASSPAVSRIMHGTVYVTLLNKGDCATGEGRDGEVIALAHNWGQVRWRRRIGPSESPPLVVGNSVYVGDWRGNVYALDARTGKTRWRFRTGGRIKGGLSYLTGRVFVGSYDHHVYALSARSGRLLWKAAAQQRFGKRGTFYSTPAVAYGRVYIGATDGKVYSFGAH